MVPVASTTPLAVAAALPAHSRVQYAASWISYVWLFKVAWEIPYDKPEKLRPRLRLHYPIRIDSAIGRGLPPGVRLQRALREPPRVNALDKALTGVYYALSIAPHAVLGWILLRHEEHFPWAAGRLAGVYHITTLGYWYLPTAPPWWASEHEGLMGGEIRRVTRSVRAEIRARLSGREGLPGGGPEDDYFHQGNPWGSMPSDALPGAAITARSLAEISARAGALGWACTGLLGFALVYLGEHYVIDLIAGLAVAEGVWRAQSAALPLVRIGIAILRGLEREVVG
jgi:membrane-associated phospholipid phosphatase